MARLNLGDHWKFRRLVCALAALDEPVSSWPTDATPMAIGILELLWQAGYAAVSDYVGKPSEIATLVHWRGDPLVLVTLLRDARFLDARGPDEYAIHDLWDHAPRFAQLRRTRKRMSDPIGPTNVAPIGTPLPDRPSPAQSLSTEQRKSSAARASRSLDWNDDVLVPLGYELVRQGKRFETDADLKEALKALAARYNVAYDADSITRALDALKHARAPLWFPQGSPA
jgi:hypothetical protein